MTATTAYCTSNAIFYQLQILAKTSPLTPILRLTAVSSSPNSLTNIVNSENQSKSKATPIDDYDHQLPSKKIRVSSDTSDQSDGKNKLFNTEMLKYVGLRPKNAPKIVVKKSLKPLTKRLAVPVCLLPLPHNYERVRDALNIVLPYLKFISIIHDYEKHCPSDKNTEIEILSSQFVSKTRRKLPKISKSNKSHRLSKEDFIALATNAATKKNGEVSMNECVDLALNCHVHLDRLDDVTIDRMIKNTIESNSITGNNLVRRKRTSRDLSNRSRKALKTTTTRKITTTTTTTTITALTTQKTAIKQGSSIAISPNLTKRTNTSDHDNVIRINSKQNPMNYERIYLKCFICSKREYIDAKVTNSDILHLHWLQHGHDLSLNIYDSEIDSILTRVVEFFHFPRRHSFEGKVQTVFILNSEEVRKTRPVSTSDDSCIVLD